MGHKLISPRWKYMVIISSFFLTLNTVVFGVPLSMLYSNQENIRNENFAYDKEYDKKLADSSCIVNGSKYGEGEYTPGAGPCEECICHPPNVVCSMMKCPINIGCITIQLPNKCCPKYKCDCEHKGKQYNNGEKINKSDESDCRVCFCNGGEIVCTSIVCYTRNDCQGYYLPGDCCPKYDNCSSTLIEQKQKESITFKKSNGRKIDNWSDTTEHNFNEESIWKRDTAKSQNQELTTVPITFQDPETVIRDINTSLPYFEELDASTANSMLDKNITFDESDIEINNLVTVGESSKTSFLGFEIDNFTTYRETTDTSFITNNSTSEIIPQFEELFDTTTDIDNSVIITDQNGTETIIGLTEEPVTEEIINSVPRTSSTHVEIFNPNDLMLDTGKQMIELSTMTSEIDITTEMDYEWSREATTPRAPDKSTIGTPHKLVMDTLQKTIEDEMNTENTFTDLEDTTDMFGPNFGYKTQTPQTPFDSNTDSTHTKKNTYTTTFLPTILTTSKIIKEITTEHSQNELFNQSFTNSNIKNIKNNISENIEYDPENITIITNKSTEMYNDTSFLELETENSTLCVNSSCTNSSKLNDELLNFQSESTTPFIIETKLLPSQDSLRSVIKKITYPKEYPDEFETIQNGPSLTITKRTYTSIPDIIYTTTTMVTLPTLELIYKADKEIEKYLSEIQSTTIKPSNSLRPLQNISFLNPT
ncbi:Kielin/chordin-like protein [Aphis craccivora]|uniref:Kielin/chordin-like protein n=1 Tax=Aphis craccivora TaxID=307492 RepID=A0A6G0Y8N6_APHCR|nr:Kielin/chordin-like protein [Aphis craccivora]